ncbi:MAG: hypothetical protein IPL21_10465 [Saprospirales bacterium]|nr:hypothetical protein [Saprospirales bacterium]
MTKSKNILAFVFIQNDYLAQIGKENTIGKDFSGDIYAMVVYDLPDTVMNIQPAHFKVWNKTLDEVLEEGIKNIKSKYTSRITQEKFGEFKIWFVNGDHFFAPNIVFDFHNQKHLIGSKGALIGIPHRHSVIIYPIENLEVVKVVNAIVPAIYGMNQEGPGSISNNLFWYSNGQFENLPYTIENGKFQFHPTENFVEILNTLEIG